MDLLVLGANGLLGSNIVHSGLANGCSVAGTYHSTAPDFDIPLSQLDITDGERLCTVIDVHDPDWVLNCAAKTDVDACEEHPDSATAVNAAAPGEIAAHCERTGRNLLHVSTDYVFNGKTTEPYSERAPTSPRQTYGRSKLAGEKAVRRAMEAPLVVRHSFVHGVHRGRDEVSGFPVWVQSKLRAGEEVPLFTDQRITPSRAGQTAETILELLNTDPSGTYNIAAQSCVSPYEFGEEICRVMGADRTLLAEATLREMDRTATRPVHTCLNVAKIEAALGRAQPTIEADVEAIAGWLQRTEGES